MYHSAATARDRDRLRQQVLEGLGWNIHRIWSHDWIQNRKSEIEKVIKAVSDAKDKTDRRPPPNKKKKLIDRSINETVFKSTETEASIQPKGPLSATPYKQHKLQRQSRVGGDALLDTSLDRISDAFTAIVNADGPY